MAPVLDLLRGRDDQDRGVAPGRHAGDWEVVQYRAPGRRPDRAVYIPARGRRACPASHIRRAADARSCSSRAGHTPRTSSRGPATVPGPTPTTTRTARASASARGSSRIADAGPPWMSYTGALGRHPGGLGAGRVDSPRGPASSRGPWTDPTACARGAERARATLRPARRVRRPRDRRCGDRRRLRRDLGAGLRPPADQAAARWRLRCQGLRIRGPSAVMATVNSKCAASEPSWE